MKFETQIYRSEPIRFESGIPIFSKVNYYVENYDRISSDHLDHFQKTGHNPFMNESHWQEIEFSTEKIVNHYISRIHDPIKILDVGVGMGRLLERFPYLDRYGVDISLGYLRHAYQKGINVCMALIEDLPYKDDYFDIVVCTDVLEHVLDLNLAVKNILRTLKPGGTLVVRVPYREDLSGYLSKGYPYDLVHLRNFDEHSLIMLFSKIFNQNVLYFEKTGFRGGTIKYLSKVRVVRFGTRILMSLLEKFSSDFHRLIARVVNEPIEINLVVQKPMPEKCSI